MSNELKAFIAGKAAWEKQAGPWENPFPWYTPEAEAWEMGWHHMERILEAEAHAALQHINF